MRRKRNLRPSYRQPGHVFSNRKAANLNFDAWHVIGRIQYPRNERTSEYCILPIDQPLP
jgi:hypothetical protein